MLSFTITWAICCKARGIRNDRPTFIGHHGPVLWEAHHTDRQLGPPSDPSCQKMLTLDLREKFTFLIVGGFCASWYIILAWALHFFGLSPTASSAWAYTLCLPLGYFGQRLITFRSARRHSVASVGYFTVQGVALLIVTAVTFVSANVLGHPPIVAFVLAGIAAASASYLMQKNWVFREDR